MSATEAIERAALWAARLADGQVPADQQAEFQAWLDADPANETALREIVGSWEAVEYYAASAEVMALREAALASARRSLHRRAPREPTRRRVWALIAATLLLVVTGVGGGSWMWLSPRVYETAVGERRVVVLADGSKVSLDAATKVKVRYTSEKRRLWLERGRAKFDVARDPLRPFSVTAANELVVATGTAFSIELVQSQVRVVLYEGHVMVLDRNGGGVRRTVAVGPRQVLADQLLSPGRELILPAREAAPVVTAAAVVGPSDPVRSLSWEAGQLVFEDEPLGVVVERMNRYASRPMTVGDRGAAGVRVSGVFRAGDMDALMQGLAAAFDLKARSGPDGMILVSE